jgi:hypothetical protein
VLLGAVAFQVSGKLLWDAKNVRFTNSEEANKYVRPFMRKGWENPDILKMYTEAIEWAMGRTEGSTASHPKVF